MKAKLLSLMVAAALGTGSRAAIGQDLFKEMHRIGVTSALVVASEAIDEHPVWSPKGDALAVNVDGRWVELKLSPVSIVAATWRRDKPIGAVKPTISPSAISESRVRAWEKSAHFDPRRVVTRDGTTVELRQEDLSTAFVITRKGGQPETLWTSGMENCYGLALAPDEQSVAYVCEQNGIVVTALR